MSDYFHASSRTIQRLKQVQALLDQLDPDAAPQALIVPGSPIPQGNIIVFPGSFNPPTNAHLALLKQARNFAYSQLFSMGEGAQPIQLYAALSKRTTDKEHVDRPLMLDRIMLLSTVLRRRIPDTGILLFNRGLYVEQAQAIRTSFGGVKGLFFLLGFDKIVQILDARYYADRNAALNELFALAELLVAPRGEEGLAALTDLLKQAQNQAFAARMHGLPLSAAYRDISSRRIRQHREEYLQDVPLEVQRFICETRAYTLPLRLADGSEIDSYAERVKALEARLKSATLSERDQLNAET